MSNEIGRGSDKFMLRLPDGMRDELKALAEANKRSMNAEIVARLEASMKAHELDILEPQTMLEILGQIIERESRDNKQLRGQISRIQEKYGPFSADDFSEIEGQNAARLHGK